MTIPMTLTQLRRPEHPAALLDDRGEGLVLLGRVGRSNAQPAYAAVPVALALVERRVEELRARSSAFAPRVRDGGSPARPFGRRRPGVATVGVASQA